MHNAFQNKRRRFVNFRDAQTGNILPEHFAEMYPNFISLLERYYEFQDANSSTELLSHLFASRDINETDLTLLTFIEDELLLGEAYFDGFGNSDVELRAAANFSNILFRSKGSKFAIEWFFRSFYGEDVEVIYPKENIFTIGDQASQLGPQSLRFLTDDKLYQTFALLIRVGIPISKWKEVFKLFTHPAGMYLGGEVFLVNEVEVGVKTLNDVIDQYTTPSYVMTPNTQTVSEGTAISLTVTGTDVRNNGTDALFYYFGERAISGDSVEAEDFEEGFGLPDSNNPKYLEINNSQGTISIATVIDELVEATESVQIILTDADGRFLDSSNANILDVLSTYTIALDSSRPNRASDIIFEGDTAVFNVTGTNVAFGGDVDLDYYVDLASDSNFGEAGRGKINASDLPAGFPTLASPATVSLTGGTGQFSINTLINTSLVNLLDITPASAANVSVGTTINVYNDDVQSYTIPAGSVLSIPFKTLNFTDNTTTGNHTIPAEATRSIPANHNLVIWISEEPGGSTGTIASSVVSASDPTLTQTLTWQHTAVASGIQTLDPDTVYYQNHAVIANTADYSNWTSGDLSPSSFDYVAASSDVLTLIDPIIEPDDIGIGALERMVIKLKSQTTGQEKGKGAIYLEGVAPEFNVSSTAQVVEGDDITIQIAVLEDQIGDTFTWSIVDPDLSPLTDTRVPNQTGTFTAASAGNQVITVATTFLPAINGTETGSLASAGGAQRTFNDARVLVTNNNTGQTATDGIQIFDGPPSYVMSPSTSPGIQGDSAAFLILASNITDTETWFYAGLAETTLADYDSDVPLDASRQRVYLTDLDANGFHIGKVDDVNTPLIGSPTYGDRPRLIFASDGDASPERVELYLYDDQTGGNKLAEINYTVAPVPVNFAGATTLNETTNKTETYTVTGLADGTYNFYYEGTEIDTLGFGGLGATGFYEIDADDFDTYYSQGSPGTLTISSGTGTLTVDVKEDKVREGDEKFKIVVTDTLGFIQGSSPEITITDTSVPTYTIANYGQLNSTAGGPITTVDEDDNLNLLITADSRMTETLYVELIDVDTGAIAIYNDTQLTVDAVDGENWLQFTTGGDNGVSDGSRNFRVILWEQGFPVTEGSALATLDLTMEDPSAVEFILTADDTTPNENQLVTFNITGSNIPDGTYYYALTNMSTRATASSGTSSVLPISQALTGNGTPANGDGEHVLNGTISSASSTQILMTNSNTFGGGQSLYFMPDGLFDYFSPRSQCVGSVSVTNNTGSFTVQLGESTALVDQAFTMGLYEFVRGGNLLTSETFTIQNQTAASATVGFVITDTFFDDFELFNQSAGQTTGLGEASIRLRLDGKIYRTGTGPSEGSSNLEYVADNGNARWASGTVASGAFEARYDLLASPGTVDQVDGVTIVGSTGTWEDIDANGVVLSLVLISSNSDQKRLNFSVTAREKANTNNTATEVFTTTVAGGNGGGLIVTLQDAGNGDGEFEFQ